MDRSLLVYITHPEWGPGKIYNTQDFDYRWIGDVEESRNLII
jgi:hypothetical protein